MCLEVPIFEFKLTEVVFLHFLSGHLNCCGSTISPVNFVVLETKSAALNALEPKSAQFDVLRIKHARAERPFIAWVLVAAFVEVVTVNVMFPPLLFVAVDNFLVAIVTLSMFGFDPLQHFNRAHQSVGVLHSRAKLLITDIL